MPALAPVTMARLPANRPGWIFMVTPPHFHPTTGLFLDQYISQFEAIQQSRD
jgi:hypothetical protein